MLAVVLLSFSTVTLADGLAPGESARIEYLLSSIAALPDAQFVRNGSAYDARRRWSICAASCATPAHG